MARSSYTLRRLTRPDQGNHYAHDYQAANQMAGSRDFGIFARRESP